MVAAMFFFPRAFDSSLTSGFEGKSFEGNTCHLKDVLLGSCHKKNKKERRFVTCFRLYLTPSFWRIHLWNDFAFAPAAT